MNQTLKRSTYQTIAASAFIALLCGCSEKNPRARVEHVEIIKVVEPVHDEPRADFDKRLETLSRPYTVVETEHSYRSSVSPGQRYIIPGVWGDIGEDFDLRTDLEGVIASEE